MISDHINQELLTLKEKKNYRSLPPLIHDGRNVILNGQRMVNLSSNDYLGLANNISLRKEFLKTITPEIPAYLFFFPIAYRQFYRLSRTGTTTGSHVRNRKRTYIQ